MCVMLDCSYECVLSFTVMTCMILTFPYLLRNLFLVKNLSLLKNHNEISLHTCLNGSYQKDMLSCFSCVQLFATP